MKKMRLTPEEHAIERALLRGEYRPASRAMVKLITAAIARHKRGVRAKRAKSA